MINNGFIVDYELDEYALINLNEKLARYSSTSAKTLTIAPTLGCNMACPYCFESHKNKKGMDLETQEQLLNFIKAFTKDASMLKIIWFGGEPLIELNTIVNLSHKIIELCTKNNIRYESSIVTNGILLNYNTAKILVDECKISHVQITIDGLRDVHNSRRKLINNDDSFGIIIDNIESVKELIDISIRVNVDKDNEDQVIKLIDFFILDKQWGNDDRITFYFGPIEKSTEECNISDDSCFDPVEFAGVLKASYEHLYKHKYYHAFERLFSVSKLVCCGAVTQSSLVIDPLGDIYTCWNTLGNTQYKIGNISDKLVINTKWIPWLDIDRPQECNSCNILPLCRAECAFKRLKNGNKVSCSHKKNTYKDLLKYIYKSSIVEQVITN